MGTHADRIRRAELVLQDVLGRAQRQFDLRQGVGRQATASMLATLRRADRELGRRLREEARTHGGPEARFTGASAAAYRRQIQVLTEYTASRMQGATHDAAMATVRTSYAESVRTMARLEEAFTGVSRPVAFDEAMGLQAAQGRVSGALLRRIPTSMDRYRARIAGQVERVLQDGLLTGASQSEMIDRLQAIGGPRGRVSLAATVRGRRVVRLREADIPEGLFARHRYWAARLVRTEIAYAQSAAALEAMHQAEHDTPGGKKKILAMMDNRTAPDSLAVHGQIRGLHEEFVDGAGRRYQHPPARPNDREVIIPWRDEWPEAPSSEQAPLDIREALAQSSTGLMTPDDEAAMLARIRDFVQGDRSGSLERARAGTDAAAQAYASVRDAPVAQRRLEQDALRAARVAEGEVALEHFADHPDLGTRLVREARDAARWLRDQAPEVTFDPVRQTTHQEELEDLLERSATYLRALEAEGTEGARGRSLRSGYGIAPQVRRLRSAMRQSRRA